MTLLATVACLPTSYTGSTDSQTFWEVLERRIETVEKPHRTSGSPESSLVSNVELPFEEDRFAGLPLPETVERLAHWGIALTVCRLRAAWLVDLLRHSRLQDSLQFLAATPCRELIAAADRLTDVDMQNLDRAAYIARAHGFEISTQTSDPEQSERPFTWASSANLHRVVNYGPDPSLEPGAPRTKIPPRTRWLRVPESSYDDVCRALDRDCDDPGSHRPHGILVELEQPQRDRSEVETSIAS